MGVSDYFVTTLSVLERFVWERVLYSYNSDCKNLISGLLMIAAPTLEVCANGASDFD